MNDAPVEITVDGKPYHLYLRFKRIYHDYTIKLHDVVHERYTGTQVARDFASHVTLTDPTTHTTLHRIAVYEAQTLPLLAYNDGRGSLHPIDAVGTIDEVPARVLDARDRVAAERA